MGKESMIGPRLSCLCVVLVMVGLILPGCKKKDDGNGLDPGVAPVSQNRIDATRDAMTGDMQKVSFAALTEAHLGRQCVVTARTMADTAKLGPPPPPPGMCA